MTNNLFAQLAIDLAVLQAEAVKNAPKSGDSILNDLRTYYSQVAK